MRSPIRLVIIDYNWADRRKNAFFATSHRVLIILSLSWLTMLINEQLNRFSTLSRLVSINDILLPFILTNCYFCVLNSDG